MASVPPVGRASTCPSTARLLGAHLDGQLDAATTLAVDDHLAQCETCRERVELDRAVRGSLKNAMAAATPSDVRSRLLAAMASAASDSAARGGENGENDVESQGRPIMLRHWRTVLPFASAAAIALAWGFARQQPMSLAGNISRVGAGFSNDALINQFVEVHRRPLRPETPDPKEVRGFEREVGVPVRVPQLEKNARFLGGRLLPVQGGERAAMLQYEVSRASGGVQRVSVFIYDPRRIQLHGIEQAPPHAASPSHVHVGQANGYSVAVSEHGAVGYAVASDQEDAAEYALAVDRE